jgi:hypothetical protein
MLALALAGFTAACGNDNGTRPTEERFIATLTGASERPTPVTTNTTGTATLTFTNDTTMSYAITLGNATGITAAHIHIGGTEVAGGIIAGLFPNAAPGVNIANGTLVEGRVTPGNMGTNNLGLNFESLKGLIRGGGAYVNVHSTAHPGGVVRGQLMRQ